jgi:hypothetical protein
MLKSNIDPLESRVDAVVEALHTRYACLHEALNETRSGFEESVQKPIESVKTTVDNLRDSLDVHAHITRHPLVAIGAAFVVGALVARLLKGKVQRAHGRSEELIEAQKKGPLAFLSETPVRKYLPFEETMRKMGVPQQSFSATTPGLSSRLASEVLLRSIQWGVPLLMSGFIGKRQIEAIQEKQDKNRNARRRVVRSGSVAPSAYGSLDVKPRASFSR